MITRKVLSLFTILFFFTFSLLNAQAVSQSITVSSGTYSKVLSFGLDPSATDGIDLSLGEAVLPPVPPGGIFDARFKLPNSEYSWKDYRQGTASSFISKDYEIHFAPDNGLGIKIEWDLPAGYKGTLKDKMNGLIISTTVKGKGEISLTPEQVEQVDKLILSINFLLGTLSAPTLLSPADNAVNIPLTQTFSWNAVTNATDYLLVLAKDIGFTDSIGVYYPANTSIEVTGLLNDRDIYWKVIARNRDAANPLSPASAIRKFHTVDVPPPVPVLQTPIDNAVGLSRKINFTWEASEGANFYKLQIAEDENFNNIFWEDSTITDDVAAGVNQIVDGFAFSADYWYRVRARNGAGNSPYTIARKFSIVTINWLLDFSVANNREANKDTLRIGAADSATDLIDPIFGELSLPPNPPTAVFDVRLKLSSTESSAIDFRPTADNITYTILLQCGDAGYPLTFSWDKTKLPEGMFTLKDPFGGIYLNVDMKSENSATLTEDAVTSVIIEYTKKISIDLALQNSWNIISVPITADDMTSSVLFPSAISPAWKYDNGYTQEATAKIGLGYWLRMPSAQTVTVSGQPTALTTVNVKLGWNLIGVYDKEESVANITTTPADLLNSRFFGYGNGYFEPASLVPGKGYWIRAKQDGELNFHYTINKGTDFSPNTQSSIVANSGKLIIKDALNNSSTLYLISESADLTQYDLPPLPPNGIFDARFSSGRMAESASSIQSIDINSANYPVSISISGTSVKIFDENGKEWILNSGSNFSITNPEINKIRIQSTEIPLEYSLLQNYPNPFNPTTTIRFTIPQKSAVNLSIYNLLGEEINRIVNKVLDAGSHQYEWDASGMPSGIYIYKLSTEKFTSNKKMLLIK